MDYPSNSNNRENNEPIREKKIDSIVSEPTKTKKKSGFSKFMSSIVAEDMANVRSYIFIDVLIPAIKKAIDDIIKNGIDMLLYGSSSKPSKSNVSKVSYGKFYEKPEERLSLPSNVLNYDDILFANRGDAEAVLSAMEDIIEQYGVVSVGDLYDLAAVSTTNYTVNKYGWTNLRSAEVVRGRDGYLIKLPRALPIT